MNNPLPKLTNQLQANSRPLLPPPLFLAFVTLWVVECVKMCLHNFIKITVKNFHVCQHTPRGKSPEKTPPWEPKTRTRNASNSNVNFPKTTPTLPWPPISPAQLSIGILQVSKIFQSWKWLSTHPYTQLPLPNWHKLLQGLWLTLCVCVCACVKLIFIIGFCDLVIIIMFLSIYSQQNSPRSRCGT